MTDLTERLRASVTYQYMPMNVRKMMSEAATTLETLTQEVERLRGLLIDPGDPAWEDARAVLVAELRKAEMGTHADNVAAGHAMQIPSWIALNLIAHSRKSLTQENARLREAGWRGIESAPTDPEDPILLLLYEWHDMGGFMFVGTFDHAKSQWFNNLDHQTQHPTHWMPLPPDPARKALGGGDE